MYIHTYNIIQIKIQYYIYINTVLYSAFYCSIRLLGISAFYCSVCVCVCVCVCILLQYQITWCVKRSPQATSV